MDIKIYSNPSKTPNPQKQKILDFIDRHIAEGSVIMQSNVYESASIWVVLEDKNRNILGISAQKLFKKGKYNLMQIMGTFLDKAVRGRNFASILLQGYGVLKLLRGNFFKPTYWCARTRISGVYSSSLRHNFVYPRLNNFGKNRKMYPFAIEIASLVYGQNVILDQDSFVLKYSYPEKSIFLNPTISHKSKKQLGIKTRFNSILNFDENQAVFLFSRVKIVLIIKFLILTLSFKFNHFIKKIMSDFNKSKFSKLLTGVGEISE